MAVERDILFRGTSDERPCQLGLSSKIACQKMDFSLVEIIQSCRNMARAHSESLALKMTVDVVQVVSSVSTKLEGQTVEKRLKEYIKHFKLSTNLIPELCSIRSVINQTKSVQQGLR